MDDLAVYLDRVDALVSKLEPSQQRQLSRQIGIEIRKRNAARIKANVEPAGGAMAPRQGLNVRKLRANGSIRAGQPFYYYNRLIRPQWVRDDGERIIVRSADNAPYKAGAYLKKFIMLESKAKRQMFRRLPQAKWLKSKTEAGSATVGFWADDSARIAAEHQSGTKVPARELLGFSVEDVEWIETYIIEYLATAL